jgi:hypothetical protein
VIRIHQLQNQLISLNPNDFPCIEDYLSKFGSLGLLLKDCKIYIKDDRCIYVILSKISSEYSIFVSSFHSTKEAQGGSYTSPTLESFCDYLIREQDKILHLGVINTASTSNKDLVAQKKDKSKHPKKKHPHNNKKNKGPKPSKLASTPNGDK